MHQIYQIANVQDRTENRHLSSFLKIQVKCRILLEHNSKPCSWTNVPQANDLVSCCSQSIYPKAADRQGMEAKASLLLPGNTSIEHGDSI